MPLLGSGNLLRGTGQGVMHHNLFHHSRDLGSLDFFFSYNKGRSRADRRGIAGLTELVDGVVLAGVGLILLICACPVVSSGSTNTCWWLRGGNGGGQEGQVALGGGPQDEQLFRVGSSKPCICETISSS